MTKKHELYPVYVHSRSLFGALMLLHLVLLGIERHAAGLYAQLLTVLQKLPAPISGLPALLQQQDILWALWMWIWGHSWMIFLALLLLPRLEGLRRPMSVVCDLAVCLVHTLVSGVRRTVGWVIRLRCKEVTLVGCQYVIVEYQDGSEKVVNIRESRTWSDWQGHPDGQVCLKNGDRGEVMLVLPEGQYLTLEDRCPMSPDPQLRERCPELRAVEYITLYDDFRR